jgi:hypothetical protein
MNNDNKQYRYRLEHCAGNKRKSICPACGRRTFVPYIDVETGERLADDVGRCDREINCAYHKTPRQHFEEKGSGNEKRYWFPKKDENRSAAPNGYSTINPNLVEASMERACFNNFNVWLREHFNSRDAMEATLRYKVGGHSLWPGATVFWQIDQLQRVRAGKIMLYDHHTGHRVKNPEAKIGWVHRLPHFHDFRLRQCLFGLHLLRPETQTVAIVEAEKTAVVASMFFPDVLFLATGGITNLRKETCEPLKNKRVILFPDLGAEEIWAEKAKTIPGLNNSLISRWLSNIATEEMRRKGLDIADILENRNPETKLSITDFI